MLNNLVFFQLLDLNHKNPDVQMLKEKINAYEKEERLKKVANKKLVKSFKISFVHNILNVI